MEETDLSEVNPELVKAAAADCQLIQSWRDRPGVREALSLLQQDDGQG